MQKRSGLHDKDTGYKQKSVAKQVKNSGII